MIKAQDDGFGAVAAPAPSSTGAAFDLPGAAKDAFEDDHAVAPGATLAVTTAATQGDGDSDDEFDMLTPMAAPAVVDSVSGLAQYTDTDVAGSGSTSGVSGRTAEPRTAGTSPPRRHASGSVAASSAVGASDELPTDLVREDSDPPQAPWG